VRRRVPRRRMDAHPSTTSSCPGPPRRSPACPRPLGTRRLDPGGRACLRPPKVRGARVLATRASSVLTACRKGGDALRLDPSHVSLNPRDRRRRAPPHALGRGILPKHAPPPRRPLAVGSPPGDPRRGLRTGDGALPIPSPPSPGAPRGPWGASARPPPPVWPVRPPGGAFRGPPACRRSLPPGGALRRRLGGSRKAPALGGRDAACPGPPLGRRGPFGVPGVSGEGTGRAPLGPCGGRGGPARGGAKAPYPRRPPHELPSSGGSGRFARCGDPCRPYRLPGRSAREAGFPSRSRTRPGVRPRPRAPRDGARGTAPGARRAPLARGGRLPTPEGPVNLTPAGPLDGRRPPPWHGHADPPEGPVGALGPRTSRTPRPPPTPSRPSGRDGGAGLLEASTPPPRVRRDARWGLRALGGAADPRGSNGAARRRVGALKCGSGAPSPPSTS